MAYADTLLGGSVERLGRRLLLAVGSSVNIAVATLTGNVTCTTKTPMILRLDPNGSNRTVTLLTGNDAKGEVKLIQNAGSANTIAAAYGSGPTTLATLQPGEWGVMYSADGATYYAATASSLTTALATAATWTARQTFTGGLSLGGAVDSPMTSAQDIATGGTITLPTTGMNKALDATAGAATGAILTAGTVAGQFVILHNKHASNSITFAAAGTSNVADGTGCAIPALKAKAFTWDATASRWFAWG